MYYVFVNVLIVEDESIVAWDLKERLESMGHNVVGTVRSGEEALKIVEKVKVDLVFMDIRLAGVLDGIETAVQIKNNFNVYIIYISANSDFTTHNEIKQTRPYQYLIKPFDDFQLQIAINNCLITVSY